MFLDFIDELLKSLGSESALLQMRDLDAKRKSPPFRYIKKGKVTTLSKKKDNQSYDFIYINGHHLRVDLSPVLSFQIDSEGKARSSGFPYMRYTGMHRNLIISEGNQIEFNKKK